MLQLLMPGGRRVSASPSTLRGIARAIRSVINPASLFTTPAAAPTPASMTVPDPEGPYEPGEMPAAEAIEAAARSYHLAADQARRSDRAKRAAKKVLGRLPAGVYSGWSVERVPCDRETVDLNAVRSIFKAHGLGNVPMKQSAPSLKVTLVEVPVLAEAVAA
ncbi:hypothetical protein AB0O91_21795 [Kitasatospora sp. NPDC089797]|uniref:hypothetical protein n=1 Tax=Kitasatospora sp. NPDC089797 TaxID=3155298 RepID=UPI003428184E